MSISCEPFFFIGVIVAGPPGSGKSTCIQTMVDALCVQSRAASRQSQHSSGKASTAASTESQHKLLRINPMVVDDTALMFGYLGHNNDWVDGVLTHAIRKANRVRGSIASKSCINRCKGKFYSSPCQTLALNY